MVNITIDNHTIAVPSRTTIMEAAASIHIPIPKLCYLKDINEIGACRVCVVEIEGQCFADDGSLWISWLQSLRQ